MFNYSNVEENNMKKSYKIDVDCANCANKMEVAANNTEGVKSAVVNFMMLKKSWLVFQKTVKKQKTIAKFSFNEK